mmetsp:Transcript_1187/g.2511  ORF Transcript_1187/g.2511 Transcript_1187/m.2511 type:complete len:94 (-) Transcript_1187:989-1270(-)
MHHEQLAVITAVRFDDPNDHAGSKSATSAIQYALMRTTTELENWHAQVILRTLVLEKVRSVHWSTPVLALVKYHQQGCKHECPAETLRETMAR